jgi:signal transduction histidine kinase
MREQVNRLEKLTTDLLDLSRLDAGSLELEREPIALHPLAVQVAREFEAAAARAGSSLEVADPGADADVEALCDPQRVAQIVRILLDNALTHTTSGARIEVRTGAGPDRTAYLEVCDDGPGIKRRDLGHVFERFHTGSPGRSGLGLAIARELANRMRGRLEVRSRPGETVFSLTLPLAGGRRPQPHQKAAAAPAEAPTAGTRA